MSNTRLKQLAGLAALSLTLAGCVAEPVLSVVPGQGKTYAQLQTDDVACRGAPAQPQTATSATVTATAASPNEYYQCMAARGEVVVANGAAPYPAYAYPAYAYAPYPYPYGYPYGPYAGYPGYFGPAVGIGVGFGFGRGYYGGYHGGYRR